MEILTPATDLADEPALAATIDELAGHCFGCGPANPEGLHLHFAVESNPAAITATTHLHLTRTHEGAPGFVHGGIIATLLDEAMSKLNRPLGVLAMTRHLDVNYLRPVPVGAPLTLIGTHLRRDGRKLFHQAELQDETGRILARGLGLFVVVDPAMLGDARRPADLPATL